MRTLESLAKEIGFNLQVLNNYITYADRYYNTFYIDKKNKTQRRQIDSPSKELKSIQRWILHEYLENIPVSKRANGFVKGRGIKRNAAFHLNKKFIMSLDIENFFLSISQADVFNSLNSVYLDEKFCLRIAKICTYRKRLPQGAPTSPTLSNIVFKVIDEEITKFCNTKLVIYSRYADDMTFSSMSKSEFVDVYHFVNDLLYKNSFTLNKAKTRYLSGKGRKMVTGLNIHEDVLKVPRLFKRDLRSRLHKFFYLNKPDDKSLNVILGQLAYIKDIEPLYYNRMLKYIRRQKLIAKLRKARN